MAKLFKFKLRVQPVKKPTRIRNKAGTAIDEKIHQSRQAALTEAIKYCQENNCSAYTAISTGLFPNVDRMTLWRRLSGKVTHGKERDYCRILTTSEESCLVEYIKNCNRSYQPLNRKDVTKLIINILTVRQANNKRVAYRNCTKLGNNAKHVLETQSLGRRFWTRFQASHPDITVKRKGNVSINRALNCTRAMAIKHTDALAQELQETGIMEDALRVKDGVWTGKIDVNRIFNHDETPQFIQYGIDGTPSGLYFSGKGESCQQLIRENRECVTIQPFVSFGGDIAMCQVIFGAKTISSNMVPDEDVCEKIQHLLISVTENGVQTANSLLAAYQEFDEYLTEKDVTRPVVLVSDGHSSRFDFDVQSFLEQKQIRLFLSPPDTTGVLQLLDQINQMLHRCYKECKDDMFSPMNTINREGFMQILSELWGKWASKDAIVNAGKKVGVTPESLSVEFMQSDKFAKAARVLESEENEKEVQSSFSPTKEENIRKNSLEYYKIKARRLEDELNRSRGAGIDLESVAGLLPVTQTVKKQKVSTEKVRVTQVCGSMKGKKVLEIVKEIKDKKTESEKQKQEKSKEKQENRNLFMKCKDACVCSHVPCLAVSLRQCSMCGNVQKSQCNKKICKVDSKAPDMISVAAREGKERMKKRKYEESESDEESFLESSDGSEEEVNGEEKENDCPGPSMSGRKSRRKRTLQLESSGVNMDDDSDDDAPATPFKEMWIQNCSDEESNDEDNFFAPDFPQLSVDDCVKIVSGRYTGFYAVIVPSSNDYVNREVIDIQYFKKQLGHYIANEGDLDTRKTDEVQKVAWRKGRRERYFFEGQ